MVSARYVLDLTFFFAVIFYLMSSSILCSASEVYFFFFHILYSCWLDLSLSFRFKVPIFSLSDFLQFSLLYLFSLLGLFYSHFSHCGFIEFFKRFIHSLFKDLYYIYKVYFMALVVCFSYVEFSGPIVVGLLSCSEDCYFLCFFFFKFFLWSKHQGLERL